MHGIKTEASIYTEITYANSPDNTFLSLLIYEFSRTHGPDLCFELKKV
jgi:hypothetical protein